MTDYFMNPKVDAYLIDGCGRCALFATPNCKVNTWKAELKKLRSIALQSGLTEELKWGVPCYTFAGDNILLLGAFKAYCTISFFKGVLLKDESGVLEAPGENSQSVRQARFTRLEDIIALEPVLKAYIAQAVDIEKTGAKVNLKKPNEHPIPEEFQQQLDTMPSLKIAFDALTPGRQRGYLLYFSAPKQAKTRAARVEKYLPKILSGKGLDD